MKIVSGKRFCRLLENKEWLLKRINGSHHIYTKANLAIRISVPVHGDKPLKKGLQIHLMKVAQIDKHEL